MSKGSTFRLLLAAALVCSTASGIWGQEKKPTEGSGQAAAQAAGQAQAQAEKSAGSVRAGTKIDAELVTAVDTRTAKPGQEVVAKVKKDVKQNGQTVIHKGDRLIGKIDSVEANAAADAGSRMAVTFDRLARGESTSQLHTVVSSILSTPGEQRMAEPAPAPAPRPAPAPAPSGGSTGGGLVGGVTSTVGSTVGAAGSAVGGVGSTVDATTQATLGAGAGAGLATPARAIRIDSQANAQSSSSASSMLSTKQGHLRLDSGTQMRFQVAAQSQAPEKKQ